MQRLTFLAAIILASVGVAACGKSSTSPSDASSVTVNGSLVAPSASGASSDSRTSSTASSVPADVQVSVAGTNVTARANAAGQFTLLNVPPGNVDLRFTGPGVNASLGLSDLQRGETVSISVSLEGTSAVLESQRRSVGSEEQLEGKVESLPPTTPAGSFVVAGRSVTTNDATRFFLHGAPATFSSLALGHRVHIKGQASGGALLASVVMIQNTNIGGGLNFNGIVSGFSGTRAAFQFTVNGQLIKGDTATEFFGNSVFQELVDGSRVEVKGSQRDGFVYAARIHVN